ncbi:short chain oxidoreductase [Polychaeton citri CBS 116435]|uniref:Short chain oxidoreductase n=1 Tax=Polychaeton citri CBS 116435 TaxID=1314669 RepID=A0A9P4UTR1_9PEZI|nr:short chain oxidoreductase [Polychaeton citri CBS 116435]
MSTYFITGTSRGLGLGLVAELLNSPESNAKIVFATTRDKPTAALQKLIDESSGRLVNIILDPVDLNSVKAAYSEVEKHLNGAGLDVVINNVGAMPYTPGGIATMDDLTPTFNVNVLSAHNVMSVFIPLVELGSQKKIVNISTTLGSMEMSQRFALFPVPAYKITKAAMNMLTVQYAQEYASKDLVIFALSPGWVKTDLGSDAADLTVEESTKAILDAVHTAGKETNGQFRNVLVKGWEENPGLNQYPGGVSPW